MRKTTRLIWALLFSALLTSCATTLNVDVTRPAKLDLNGAKTISVLPIKPSGYYYGSGDNVSGVVIVISDFFSIFDRTGPEERRCVAYLHDEVERGLMRSPYVQVISPNAVQSALNNGTEIPADVYLTGEVIYFDIFDEREVVRKKVKDDGDDYGITSVSSSGTKYVTEEYFVRHVKMDLRYQVVDSKTNRIISYDRASIRESSSRYDRRSYLPSAYSMIEGDLSRISRNILRDLQPYVVRKSIKLMKDKSKLPEMKSADDLAKAGYLSESYESFVSIWRERNILEAGYNAAVILEALGRLNEAETLMKEVYVLYPQTDVLDGLYDIQSELRQSQRLQGQIQ